MSIIPQSSPSPTSDGALLARWESYKFGWDLYAAGEPISACQNAEQRRGWWSALEAQADTETYAYLEGQLEDQIEGRLDNEYHARGQW